VISFGAGEGLKDRMLLKALRDSGLEVKYYPLMRARPCSRSRAPRRRMTTARHWELKPTFRAGASAAAADVSEAPRLFLMAGNTLGGFDPLDQMRHVSDCLHEGDLLVLDARIREENPPDPTEAQKRFVFAPLASAGLTQEDGELRFTENSDDRHEGLYLLTRRFHASKDLTMLASGRQIHIERGERIFLNFRYRFTRQAFRWLVSEHAGLQVIAEIPSSDGRFVTIVCSK